MDEFADRPSTGPWQRVLNQSWPPHPERYRHEHKVPVTVRVVFATDGQTWLDGTAVAWSARHVKVGVGDQRLQVAWVWVDPADVRRR